MATKIERLAAMAMKLINGHLSDWGSYKNRKDFTQKQLMELFVFRSYLKTIFRGHVDILAGH